jgi:hypothetical protein
MAAPCNVSPEELPGCSALHGATATSTEDVTEELRNLRSLLAKQTALLEQVVTGAKEQERAQAVSAQALAAALASLTEAVRELSVRQELQQEQARIAAAMAACLQKHTNSQASARESMHVMSHKQMKGCHPGLGLTGPRYA